MKIYHNIKPNFVRNFFSNMTSNVLGNVFITSPFFSETSIIKELNAKGYKIQLIVRLSEATSPQAIEEIIDLENVQIRFFNDHYFHSKIYITPTDCMIGSSNMTENGVMVNSEVNIAFNNDENYDLYCELTSLFEAYWKKASVFTKDKLVEYKRCFNNPNRIKSNFENVIKQSNVLKTNSASAASVDISLDKESNIVQNFQREYQNFQKYMNLLKSIYNAYGERIMPADVPVKYEIDRFLSFLQTENYYKVVDMSYRTPLLYGDELKNNIKKYLDEWFSAKRDINNSEWNYTLKVIPEKYLSIQNFFASPDNIDKASLSELFDVLFKIHSFHDQHRNHCKESEFKQLFESNTDEQKLKKTLKYLIFGRDNFYLRIMNVVSNSEYKIQFIGEMSATELSGWVDTSEERYIYNSRVLKSLRFLGCDISI